MPARRQEPKPEPKPPGRLVGDINAPYVNIKFDGVFPDLVGVGEAWTVERASRWLAMTRKDSIPNAEIDALFGELFAAANPEAHLSDYPTRLQLRAISSFFTYRLDQIEPTAEIVRNEPAKLRTGS